MTIWPDPDPPEETFTRFILKRLVAVAAIIGFVVLLWPPALKILFWGLVIAPFAYAAIGVVTWLYYTRRHGWGEISPYVIRDWPVIAYVMADAWLHDYGEAPPPGGHHQ